MQALARLGQHLLPVCILLVLIFSSQVHATRKRPDSQDAFGPGSLFNKFVTQFVNRALGNTTSSESSEESSDDDTTPSSTNNNADNSPKIAELNRNVVNNVVEFKKKNAFAKTVGAYRNNVEQGAKKVQEEGEKLTAAEDHLVQTLAEKRAKRLEQFAQFDLDMLKKAAQEKKRVAEESLKQRQKDERDRNEFEQKQRQVVLKMYSDEANSKATLKAEQAALRQKIIRSHEILEEQRYKMNHGLMESSSGSSSQHNTSLSSASGNASENSGSSSSSTTASPSASPSPASAATSSRSGSSSKKHSASSQSKKKKKDSKKKKKDSKKKKK